MAFSSNSGGGPMVDMNVTPLVDVMLVLLIIFMVTAPILSYPIDIDLPQRTNKPPENQQEPPEPVKLRIDSSGQVYWNGGPVDVKSLQTRMEDAVSIDPNNQPTLEIDMSEDAQYEVLAKVLGQAKDAEMKKIGFVKKP